MGRTSRAMWAFDCIYVSGYSLACDSRGIVYIEFKVSRVQQM